MKINEKDLTTSLAAMSAFLSIFESLIPTPVPFLRLGLANIPICLALPFVQLKNIFFIVVFIKCFVPCFFYQKMFSSLTQRIKSSPSFQSSAYCKTISRSLSPFFSISSQGKKIKPGSPRSKRFLRSKVTFAGNVT